MKTCTKCNTEKPSLEFNKHKHTKDGLNSWCKPCTYKQNKEYDYKISAVYGIYDKVCLYIGQSKQLSRRIEKHKYMIKYPHKRDKQKYLYEALDKHSNVSIRIIEECSPELLLTQEQYYINTLKPKYNNYGL